MKFEDLTDKTCKYAFGNSAPFKFCGKEVLEKSPYCPEHTVLCYNKYIPSYRIVMGEKK